MLVDVFLYNGETDMLALRVATLGEHVDRMVAVTCTLTHQSEPAPAVDVGLGVQGQWLVNAVPIPEGRGGQGTPYYQWIERQHRNGCRDAVADLPGDAVVMVSDVDEIPDPAVLGEIAERAGSGPVSVPMRMHGFALNYLYPQTWIGTTASTVAAMAPQAHRDWRYRLSVGWPGDSRSWKGWHLSWFGDLDEKRRKLASFSHAELASLDVEDCYATGTHANGERMIRTPRADVLTVGSWPAPLVDGSFEIPPSWWAPEEG